MPSRLNMATGNDLRSTMTIDAESETILTLPPQCPCQILAPYSPDMCDNPLDTESHLMLKRDWPTETTDGSDGHSNSRDTNVSTRIQSTSTSKKRVRFTNTAVSSDDSDSDSFEEILATTKIFYDTTEIEIHSCLRCDFMTTVPEIVNRHLLDVHFLEETPQSNYIHSNSRDTDVSTRISDPGSSKKMVRFVKATDRTVASGGSVISSTVTTCISQPKTTIAENSTELKHTVPYAPGPSLLPATLSTVTDAITAASSDSLKFHCPRCSFTTNWLSTLRKHVISAHNAGKAQVIRKKERWVKPHPQSPGSLLPPSTLSTITDATTAASSKLSTVTDATTAASSKLSTVTDATTAASSKLSMVTDAPTAASSDSEKLQCHKCSFTTYRGSTLRQHVISFHNIGKAQGIKKKERWVVRASRMKPHLMTHQKIKYQKKKPTMKEKATRVHGTGKVQDSERTGEGITNESPPPKSDQKSKDQEKRNKAFTQYSTKGKVSGVHSKGKKTEEGITGANPPPNPDQKHQIKKGCARSSMRVNVTGVHGTGKVQDSERTREGITNESPLPKADHKSKDQEKKNKAFTESSMKEKVTGKGKKTEQGITRDNPNPKPDQKHQKIKACVISTVNGKLTGVRGKSKLQAIALVRKSQRVRERTLSNPKPDQKSKHQKKKIAGAKARDKGEKVTSPSKLQKSKVQDKRKACPECQFKTGSSNRLEQHISNIHKQVKSFKCEECGYSAAQKYSLKVHVLSRHTPQEAVNNGAVKSCTECTFQTFWAHNLRQHVATIHRKERNFPCLECSYKATQNSSLKSHVKRLHASKAT